MRIHVLELTEAPARESFTCLYNINKEKYLAGALVHLSLKCITIAI